MGGEFPSLLKERSLVSVRAEKTTLLKQVLAFPSRARNNGLEKRTPLSLETNGLPRRKRMFLLSEVIRKAIGEVAGHAICLQQQNTPFKSNSKAKVLEIFLNFQNSKGGWRCLGG